MGKTAIASAGIPLMPTVMGTSLNPLVSGNTGTSFGDGPRSIIGGYGEWAASLLKDPPKLSYRNKEWSVIEEWREQAVAKAKELMAPPEIKENSKVVVERKYLYDGLEIEELSWQLPYGRATKAILLKPEGAKRPLPGILALHDHGGKKYFGRRKITKVSDEVHPLIAEHQKMIMKEWPGPMKLPRGGTWSWCTMPFLLAVEGCIIKMSRE